MTIRRGLVIGRGGTLGFAWSAVALREIERALDWMFVFGCPGGYFGRFGDGGRDRLGAHAAGSA
ncbi:MAG: hypothetical protein ACLPLP_02065 [Mycobacterium sp.]